MNHRTDTTLPRSSAAWTILIGILACTIVGGALLSPSEQSSISSRDDRITFEEFNAYADRMGREPLERLPWFDDDGRDLAELRRIAFERDPDRYRALLLQHGDDHDVFYRLLATD